MLDGGSYGGAAWIFSNPHCVINQTPRDAAALSTALQGIMHQLGSHTPKLQRAFCGVIAYEAGVLADGVIVPHGQPLILGGIYHAPNITRTMAPLPLLPLHSRPACGAFRPYMTQQAFENAVLATQEHIRAGDIFQLNLCQSFLANIPATTHAPTLATALYARLQRCNAAPYGAFLHFNQTQLISCSPELFLHVTPQGAIATEPIKGTAPRSSRAQDLQRNGKDRAENIMIADLMRHDLSKVCQPGSVRATQICQTRSFANVHHLVSRIEGLLQPHITLPQVLLATLPPGSVTGAPKHRASQIIAQQEQAPRGFYCGAIGYITNNGEAMFNVAIRTLTLRNGLVQAQAGSGITLRSNPAAEYAETMLKASRLLKSMHV